MNDLSTDQFRQWTGEYVDGIDATLFSGDEFVGSMSDDFDRRAMLREYIARWTRQLDMEDQNAREALKDRAEEKADCGACAGSGWTVRDPDIGTDKECWVCNGTGKVQE